MKIRKFSLFFIYAILINLKLSTLKAMYVPSSYISFDQLCYIAVRGEKALIEKAKRVKILNEIYAHYLMLYKAMQQRHSFHGIEITRQNLFILTANYISLILNDLNRDTKIGNRDYFLANNIYLAIQKDLFPKNNF